MSVKFSNTYMVLFMDCDLRKVGFSTCLVSVEAEVFVTCSSFQVKVNLHSMNV